ncbi:MAG: ethanolamine ammonia-lyase reactivating factor EutA [Candidatus Heimdallarchaeota archaeon]|nr:ethanolamine ammonia-lyase reactivating factor EutA [Candidatus Heimdallarchaeota archaeon]MDH5647746.1 ethanolamine ammonia-lyase reactivating factor EutA [Candidatus Heimdallarchaeota archaeon]
MVSSEEIKLLSVGIDVGSSTSHLIFSKLTLSQDRSNGFQRYVVSNREIVYEGTIIDTPLIDKKTINVEELKTFFKSEFDKAGILPGDVDTGAVIVTGETAKKANANVIIEHLSEDSGKFVSATAGPNFESLLAAMGSGITSRSLDTEKTIISVDIGGGTSNCAISTNGQVVSTSCISVGGRLVAVNDELIITRIDDPARWVMDELNLNYNLGDKIDEADMIKIASKLAESLIEVVNGPATSELAKKLMMTGDLDFNYTIDEIAFSGGVSEFIYNSGNDYNDLGKYLAIELRNKFDNLKYKVIEPDNTIRATVIGAGAYSLTISGSTCYLDPNLDFPIRNIPAIRVDIDRKNLNVEHIQEEITKSFGRFDLIEGEQVIALFFDDPVRASYDHLKIFAKGVEAALPNTIQNDIPIILVFQRDIGNSVGNVIRRETSINENLLAIDEIMLQDGDWIDIGAPLISGQVFPVTVKSLVFNK